MCSETSSKMALVCWHLLICSFLRLSSFDLLAIGNILAWRRDRSHQTRNWGIAQPEPWVALLYKSATWGSFSWLSHERSWKARKQRRPDKSAKRCKPASQQKQQTYAMNMRRMQEKYGTTIKYHCIKQNWPWSAQNSIAPKWNIYFQNISIKYFLW